MPLGGMLLLLLPALAGAGETQLFNGRDLDGWEHVGPGRVRPAPARQRPHAVFRRRLPVAGAAARADRSDRNRAGRDAKRPRRRLDVVLPTTAKLPAALARDGKTGPLTLSVQLGPLAPVTALAYSPDGKFLAAAFVWAVALALTFPIVLTVNYLGNPDNGTILAGYLGSFLVCCTFLAITMLISACTGDQVVARKLPQVVDVRDEASAVFAADAVARMTGIPGVAAVTAGPGVTNTITAVKNAQMAQSPIVIFGGAVAYNFLIERVEGEPSRISKLNTALELLFLLFVLSHAGFGWPDTITHTVLGAAILVTVVISGADYVWSWSRRARAGGAHEV